MKLADKAVLLFVLSLALSASEPSFAESPADRSLYQGPHLAHAGDRLSDTLKAWSQQSDYTLEWSVTNQNGEVLDWTLPTNVALDTDFYEAVYTLLSAYQAHTDRSQRFFFDFTFYEGNRVLFVQMEVAQ